MRWPILLVALTVVGCPKTDPAASSSPPDAGGVAFGFDLPPTRDDTRFVKIRTLLREPPESKGRATKLYPLVKPVCTDEAERDAFLEVAKWSTSFSDEENFLPTELAVDTIEHVATACFRTEPDAALDLLTKAAAFVEGTPRLDVIRARLLAARGDFADALAASKAAVANGSVHAIALTANIQAQMARDGSEDYQKGMLDEAIRTVSVEPDEKWMIIDLTAVLATRARLLSERAVWEAPEARARTLLEAAGVYRRISVSPFIAAIRTRALDNLCFDAERVSAPDACRRAAEETHNIGAAVAAGIPITAPGYDVERYRAIETMTATVAKLPAGAVVLWIARGDESELLEWVRPAAAVIEELAEKKARLVVVDRTTTKRASALIDRMFALAGTKPRLLIDAKGDTLALPCITAILADRRTPSACPLDAATQKTLEGLRPFGLGVLVGRDLDGELDDLRLYELPSLLLSFRRSLAKKGPDAWLKSVADVRLLAP